MGQRKRPSPEKIAEHLLSEHSDDVLKANRLAILVDEHLENAGYRDPQDKLDAKKRLFPYLQQNLNRRAS